MKLTYCNPLSIEDLPEGRALDSSLTKFNPLDVKDYRSIGDPSVIYHEGKWIMYPSYKVAYVSEDFVNWKYVDIGVDNLRYSPAVVNFRNKWYLCGGQGMSAVYCADSPLGPFRQCGTFTDVDGNEIRPNDGCYLADGNRLYFYWFGAVRPEKGEDVEYVMGTLGAECDPDEPWRLITKPVWINKFSPETEWQRHGEFNQNERLGYIEGQWMIKIGTRYYLLYSGSGTQYSSYAQGVMYSDEGPLSGFKMQERHNPLTLKRYGLVRGAGHGSIAKGPGNTYWVFYSNLFGFNFKFERRVSMDVIGIDENGELYCPETTEVPQFAPGVLEHPERGNGAGLLPLTFMQPAKASSEVSGREAIYATDDSVISWWQPLTEDTEKTLEIHLGSEKGYNVESMRIIWRDIGMETLEGIYPGAFQYVVEYEDMETGDWKMLIDASENTRDLCVDYRQFDMVTTKKVRLRVLGAPKGIEPGVVSFTVFGKCAH